MDTKKQWLTVTETAEYLGISIQTLYQWIEVKRIPHIRVGAKPVIRISREVLEKWKEEQEDSMSVFEAAKVLTLSPQTVRAMVKRGEIPRLTSHPKIRISRQALDAWLQSKVVKPEGS